MDEHEFEALVAEVIADLPPDFKRHLINVEVVVAPQPTSHHRRRARIRAWQTLYGLYEGVPLTERFGDDPVLPDIVTIFRLPLTRDFPNTADLRAEVRRTVLHEIAHFFGISDERLIELDAY